MDLIENKTIDCLTLIAKEDYPLLFSSLCKYNYENVKTLRISKFKTHQKRLSLLKENNGGCRIQLADMHILNNNIFSSVCNKCNIYSVIFI